MASGGSPDAPMQDTLHNGVAGRDVPCPAVKGVRPWQRQPPSPRRATGSSCSAGIREEHYRRLERSYRSFYRRLPLPEPVEPEQIEASFKDGVLEVRLPAPKEQPKAHKIALK